MESRLDFGRSLVPGLPSPRGAFGGVGGGGERGLIFRTAAGNRAYMERFNYNSQIC